MTLDEYRCHWHDPAPRVGSVALRYGILFPHAGCFVKHWRGMDIVGDSTTAVFHAPGEEYRVSHPLGCGDRGALIQFDEDLAREAVRSVDPARADRNGSAFLCSYATTSARLHAALVAAVRARNSGEADGLQCEELAMLAIAEAVARAPRQTAPRAHAAAAARRRHEAVVSDAMRILSARATEPLSLSDIAAAVGVSPFHLCRIFRSMTGQTIHQHRESLRLRAALLQLQDPRARLLEVALGVGYSSQSHFGAAFVREFGATPAFLRRLGPGEAARELSKKLRDAAVPRRHAV